MGEKEMTAEIKKRNIQLFNQPIEVGVRALFVLAELSPLCCDIQKLMYYDYLLLHSGDIDGGPPSLHPATPHRSCEILVRRQLLQSGLLMLQSKKLVVKEFHETGICYSCSELAPYFLDHFSSQYSAQLKEIVKWVVNNFKDYSDAQFEEYIQINIGRWGSEFTRESLFVEVADVR